MAPQPTTDNNAILFVMIATVALAFKGIFAKLAYMGGMSVDALLLLRFAIAAPLFWVGVYFLARHTEPLSWKQWKACALAGTAFFAATYCDFTAISLVGASISRLVLFTFPVIVILINAVLHRTLPSPQQWFVFVVTYIGIAMVMMPEKGHSFAEIDWHGLVWALGSAVTYAIYLVSSQEIMKTLGSMRFTAASGTITLAMMLIVIPLKTDVTQLAFPLQSVLWAGAIAIFCTVIPFFLLFEGIKRCGATQASLITLAGPLMTVFAAWLLLDEHLSSLQIFGAAVTILGVASLKSATLFETLRQRWKNQKALL